MRTHNKISYYLLFLLALFGACKEKYVSGAIIPSTGYLVIEGFINLGAGPTDIALTRTTSLDSSGVVLERGAEVSIVSEGGVSFPLTETQPGHYTFDQMPQDLTQIYHVHIRTADGNEYESDTSSAKITKPIDSATWSASKENVQIFVSTHDDQNNSKYYQWTFDETWQYSAIYYHIYDYDYTNFVFVHAPPEEDTLPNICWLSNQSNSILISTTEQLSKDIINEFPVNTISYTASNRLIFRYSILIKQKAIPKEWYEWIQKIKKNTESLGSIFDAQPSQTGGNFHCTSNPGEPVIGWVGSATQQEKRIFISRAELPSVDITSGYDHCTLTRVLNDPDSIRRAYGYIDDVIFDSNGYGAYGLFARPECVDCRMYGGVDVKPVFWQD